MAEIDINRVFETLTDVNREQACSSQPTVPTCDLCGVACVVDVACPKQSRIVCADCRSLAAAETPLGSAAPAMIRCSTGPNRGMYYNMSQDYAKTQRAQIFELLTQRAREYQGLPLPLEVLNWTADKYNEIQQLTFADNSRFIHRGTMKEEILARLLFYGCIHHKTPRRKQALNAFMRLPSGSARGDQVLRNLRAIGVDLPSDVGTISEYTEKYFEALGLENDSTGKEFVEEIVETSDANHIGMSSILTSKIVGAIWVYIESAGLAISSDKLEAATDNTKKTTFKKFSDEVYRYEAFEIVFERFGLTPAH